MNIKPVSLLEKLFNINRMEFSRVALSWGINFFYRMGFVVGWTMIVGMFVGRYGIVNLPILFIVNGVFTVLGSLFYMTFIDRFSKEKIMFWSIMLSCWILLFSAFFSGKNDVVFFGLLLGAISIFLVQFKIILNGFVENLFTPLESERTFSFIESAETIGGIIAGLLVVGFSASIDPVKFVYIWILALLLILPCIFYYRFSLKSVPKIFIGKKTTEHEHISILEKFKDISHQIRQVSFIKGLFFVVIFQWIFSNLIEFQYTKAVVKNISTAVLNSGSGFEHALVHDLGALFILFNVAALFVQFFVGGRLISSLGIIGSMLVHPILMLLSIFGLTVRFNFNTAVLAQANKTIGQIIHINAYHSAYYSVKEHFREHTREFLEGMARPFGAILGTGILILLQNVFKLDSDLTLAINLTMIFVLIGLFVVTYALQDKYTKVAASNLLTSEDRIDRIESIDILAQKGHKSALPVLLKVLNNSKEPDFIRLKVLSALKELQDYDAIDDILNVLESKNPEFRMAALDAILGYDDIKKFLHKNIFYEYKIAESLKKLYKSERNQEVKSLIIHLLSKLNPIGTFGFLINILSKAKNSLKADVILALGQYKDRSVISYIQPFLNSKKSYERAAAIISLWKYDDFYDALVLNLNLMLESENKKLIEAGVFAIGELKLKSKHSFCLNLLKSDDLKLQMFSAIAIAKMGYVKSVEKLIELFFVADDAMRKNLKKNIKNLPYKMRTTIESELKQIVSAKINKLLTKTQSKSAEYVGKKYLNYFKMLYSLVDEPEEIESIKGFLHSTKKHFNYK